MTLLLVVYVGAGALLAILSLPLIRGKVGPNPWYGFRVRRTLEDPAVWYPANAYAAKGMLCVGLATCAAAVLLYLIPGIRLEVWLFAYSCG
jgi:SdpI/YfhL protein family